MTFRRPVRTGVLLLLGMGLWACAGCSSGGPVDTREAERPAPAHCVPLGGDPLPSMCAPGARSVAGAQKRAPSSPGATSAPPAAVHATGDQVPVVADEPDSPELIPEAPFSGWGTPGPVLPEPGTWQEAEFTDEAPVVLEHAPASGEVPGVVADEPVAVLDQPAPAPPAVDETADPAADPAPAVTETPAEATLDA